MRKLPECIYAKEYLKKLLDCALKINSSSAVNKIKAISDYLNEFPVLRPQEPISPHEQMAALADPETNKHCDLFEQACKKGKLKQKFLEDQNLDTEEKRTKFMMKFLEVNFSDI